jgi:transcriptional regulator ATRX
VEARLKKLRKWFDNGGIIFIGYEMFRNLAISKNTRKAKDKHDFQKYLLDPGADMVVCDEGHVLRNSKSSLSEEVNKVRTRLRVVLTGTPLQNNLLECKHR